MINQENQLGHKVFDFILKDHNKEEFRLSDFKGKNILLSFHPLAWTGVCAEQMKSLENNYDKFRKLNTVAVGINVDSIPSKNAWAKSLDIKNTSLLSDFWPHGKIAKLYNIFRESQGFSERAARDIGSAVRIRAGLSRPGRTSDEQEKIRQRCFPAR